MADAQEQAKTQPEVELDLDDVKETKVEVEEQQKGESKEPNLNVGEVDLGYADHNKDKAKEEVDVQEIPEEQPAEDKTFENERETKLKQEREDPDDLTQVSESVKKRIDKLTRKFREAERREKAALDFAKGLQKKYDDTQTKFDSTDEKYLKEFDARVDAQREQVKRKLKEAIESNDADKIMEANDELTQLTVEKEKARIKMADREARLKQLEEQKNAPKEEPTQEPAQPEPSQRARDWASKNAWFGNDRIMTNAAMTVHEDLVGMGIDVESDEYYNEIDKRMKDNFPHRFASTEQRRPVQKVASAGRTQQGRRSVRLTKSQVAIAKKLGVPLEEYAKFVKEV